MPRTEVVFYRYDDGSVPVLDWLGGLPPKARLKCLVRIERLRELGNDLRRPEADFLRDGVYELRVSLNHVQYRILYYHGKRDHHKRVTTERPHPTGGSCPREGHGKGKLIRVLFSVHFGGFRG